MINLTTTDGEKYVFSAKTVAVVCDHDQAGNAVTCVYGVGKGMLQINEPVLSFLNRIGSVGKFGKLTRPDGMPVWINGKSVSAVRAATADDAFDDGSIGKALIITSAVTQRVRETPDEVISTLGLPPGAGLIDV